MKNKFGFICVMLVYYWMIPVKDSYGQSDIKISLAKWSFRTQAELLCELAKEAQIGALEMVDSLKWDAILQKDLVVAVADGADLGIERGFCNIEWHGQLIKRYNDLLPGLQKKGIKQIVCYSGINTKLNDNEALDICVAGLKPVLEIAEKTGVIVAMELISSRDAGEIFAKQCFKHYQCDNVEWGVALCKKLNSPNFKLLYDVWHMQDMGRDVFSDVKKYHAYISHYQIASYPRRGVLQKSDEFDYGRFLKELRKTGYNGYIGLEPDRVEHDLEKHIKQSMSILKDNL